ncbi:MAG: hypothetical protein QY332_09455 [Anaerolineales bacterium]|nr:MAG: hypothetical protein QY332_09455 [Anaerolineales bacterium]
MKKIFASAFLMLALLAMTTGTAFAQETTPITGTIQTIAFETDPTTGETIVVLDLLDETTGETQTVIVSFENAELLGLVTTDPITGEPTVTEDAVGMEVELDPADVIEEGEEEDRGEQEHPVGSALSNFFGGLFGVDYDTIMTVHEDGFGFGVIAQALWLTNQIDGDTATFEALLEAKQSGNYDDIVLADGSTPDNWGDVVKSLKKGGNLGSVMSGKAENGEDTGDDTNEAAIEAAGNGSSNGSNGNGNSKDKGNNGDDTGDDTNEAAIDAAGNGNSSGSNGNGKDKGNNGGKGKGKSGGTGGGRP